MTAHAARDPGLQPERTSLAWHRTALAAAALAALLLHHVISGPGGVAWGAPLAAAAAAIALSVVGHRRGRALLGGADGPAGIAIGAVTATVSICAVATAISMIWPA